jgi:hypothetical protein
MKYFSPNLTVEVVPNIAWIRGTRALISLYSLRKSVGNGEFYCDFEEALNIVQKISRDWNVNYWCFDYSAERELMFWNGTATENLFSVLTRELLTPIFALIPNASVDFIHGDANIDSLYADWLSTASAARRFDRAIHVNRFFYEFNLIYPSARPHRLIRASYTTFNRKKSVYRARLLEYLKNNNLLDKGYVNFAFENVSTLTRPLPDTYEGNRWITESDIYRYYRASNFDIIIETASNNNENQRFITEKTLRALALGQPFVAYNGTNSLQYLRDIGFRTYVDLWDENYDSIADNEQRFMTVAGLAKTLIETPDVFNRPGIKEIAEHNSNHFQNLAELDHRERWLRRLV